MAIKKKTRSLYELYTEQQKAEENRIDRSLTDLYNETYGTNYQPTISYQEQEDDIAPVKEANTWNTSLYDKWGKYTKESDYMQYSTIGANIKNPTVREAEGYANIFGWRPGAKEVGNIVTYSRDNINNIILGEMDGADMVGKSKYKWMTEDEIGVYNYVLGKFGKEKAQEFLDDIEEELNRREGLNVSSNIQSIDNGAGKAIAYGYASFAGGVDQFGSGVRQEFSSEKLPTSSMQFTNQDLASSLDGFKSTLYTTGNVIGNMTPSILLSSMTRSNTVGAVAMGISAAGNAYGQALDDGYSQGQARLYSTLVGTSEGVLQSIMGGISKLGGKAIGKAFPKIPNISNKIAMIDNSLLRIAAKYGESTIKEIGEEELQNYLEPAFRSIVFGEEYDAPTVDELIETALVTALSTGVLETGSVVQSEKSMSNSDRKVIKSAVDKEIARRKEAGENVTAKDKDKIYEDIIESIDKGYFSIDTIEEELGGDAYTEYKDTVDSEESLKAELNELRTLESNGKINGIQMDRLAELNSMKLEDTTKRDNLRAKLDDTLAPLLKNSRLAESYNERARKGQAFEADLNQYKGKMRDAIERAIKSGVLNNTNRSHELVNILAKLESDKGIVFDYTNNEKLVEAGFAVEGKTVNGYITNDGTITLNVQSPKAWQSTVGHEIGHVLKGTDAYKALRKTLFEYAHSKGELVSRKAALVELYKGQNADIYEELTSDLLGDYLFTDKNFINHLTGNRTLFQKIYDEIKYLCKVATGKELTEIEKVKREFDRAWKELGQVSDKSGKSADAKYSVGEIVDKNKKSYGVGVHLDSTLLDNLSSDERVEIVKEYVKEIGGQVFTAYDNNGNAVDITVEKANKKFKNKSGKKVKVNNDMTNYLKNPVKQEALVLVDELITTSSYKGTEPATHPHDWVDNNGENDWDVWETYIQDKENTVWKAKLRIANTTNGEKVLYDVFPIEKVDGVETIDTTSTEDSIAPVAENVKHSIFADNGKVKNSDNSKVGIEFDETSKSYSSVKYSLGSWNKSDYVTSRGKAAKDMAKTLGVTEEKATEYIDSVNGIAKMIADDKARLDYEPSPNRSAFVSNAEYGGSIDFSTICKKRRLFTGTFEAIQNALPNTALTAEEILEIRNMMKNKGYEVSCGLCYVEGSRANMGQYTRQFIERYKETNPDYVPNMAEMNTATGQEQLRKEHPEVYESYEYFMNHYGRLSPTDKALFASQQKPKMYQMATEYKDEILSKFGGKDKSKTVEAKNKNGGLRLQSFSDFEIIHLLDSMQVIMDMSRVGLAGQAYTKVPDFAWALGDTGLKINLSLIAKDVDENGRLVFDEVEGMKESDAMALRDRYSDNVGTIIVTFTDEQLKAAMADERIDFIIPYHRSQWKTSQYEAMGLPENTKDYTMLQSESYIEPVYDKNGKKQRPSNYMPNNYWDFTKSGKENAEDYLRMCAENNRKPKFSHLLVDNGDGSYSLQPDGSTDGYWKTLIDFKMYNNDGIGVPQNPVVPNFNMEESQRMLNEYTGGHAKFPVAKDIVEEFVSKHPENIAPTANWSLSENSQGVASIGNYSTPLNETALQQDVAPVQEAEKAINAPEAVPVVEGIHEDYSAVDVEETEKKSPRATLHRKIIDNIKSVFSGKGYDFDEVLKKAKNLSTFSTVDNTPQRVMEKALGYKEGQTLSDLTVNKVAQNETAGIKWLNSFTDRKNGLLAQISKQYSIKPGSKESAAAQMYAEGFYVNDNNDIVAYGDAELAQDFPNANVQKNIKGLANDPRIRRIYDETLAAINESRTRNAYPEIQKLDNYFLHFRAMEDTFSRLGLPFNPNDIRAKDLPTDLNGVTADLKPGQPYFASAMHRTGKRTSFDLLGGLERYLTSAKNQIYHIDDIQTLRALRNYIADTYGQAHGLENIDTLSEEEAQEKIEKVYGSHLSTFAKFLNEEANVLAGKTALIDRGLEGIIGRRGMTFLDTVNKQVGSNMVGFNISSSLTNFIPVAQTIAKTNKFDFLKAFTQTVFNKLGSIVGKGDSFAENSPVIIRRKGADRFYRTPFQKAGDAGYILMSAVDGISTELIARTKYNELTRKGMSEQQAHFETDKWVSRLMGDRSLGQQPQLYNSKTLGILTKFQLEVRNQLDSQFYDTIQEAKVSNEEIKNGLVRNAKTAAKVTSTFLQLAVAQHLFGKAFESVAGYNPAFDIISTIETMLGFDDDEESEDTELDNIEQGFLELLEDLPYTSTFTGGRIPISSALPISELIKGEDGNGNEKSRLETLGEVAPYYVLPGGYGQVKKTVQGLGMFSDEHPVSGSYTDSGSLRFPVEDTTQNRVQAGIFGQYASENAREYFDNEYAPLKEKQIQEYKDVDIPIKDYWEYREGLAKQEELEDKFDYIAGLDLPVEKKNILINNVVDRKEKVDLENYDDFSSLEEFDFATNNPEKYQFLEDNNISYEEYNKSDESRAAYNWAAKNPGGYELAKAVAGDVVTYRQYTSELYDIKADKDENGKSINGSRKEKVLNYINNLDADYEAKIILFKSEYPSDDTYNEDIINYVNNREDLTYEERMAIFTELGFRVSDGYIYWD